MNQFTEARLEQAIIALLAEQGYPHYPGDRLGRAPGEVLLVEDLRAYLSSRYRTEGITPNEIKGIIRQLQAYPAADLYESNKAIHKLVANVVEDFTNEIIDLLDALKQEKESYKDLDINFEEKAFYDILQVIAIKYDFSYAEPKLITLAKAIKAIVDDQCKYIDWSQGEDTKASLKVDIILALAKHGYPPVANDEVYKDILEQAENFKKYRES